MVVSLASGSVAALASTHTHTHKSYYIGPLTTQVPVCSPRAGFPKSRQGYRLWAGRYGVGGGGEQMAYPGTAYEGSDVVHRAKGGMVGPAEAATFDNAVDRGARACTRG